MIEQIKEAFQLVPNKTALYETLHKEFGTKSESIRRNWFIKWELPKKHEERVLEIMNELINNK